MKKIPYYEVREIRDLKDMLQQSVRLYKDKTLFLNKPQKGAPYVPVSFEQYEKDVIEEAKWLEKIRLKEQEAECLKREAEDLKKMIHLTLSI